MQGLMQDYPLTLPHIFHRAERLFPNKEVVTALPMPMPMSNRPGSTDR